MVPSQNTKSWALKLSTWDIDKPVLHKLGVQSLAVHQSNHCTFLALIQVCSPVSRHVVLEST